MNNGLKLNQWLKIRKPSFVVGALTAWFISLWIRLAQINKYNYMKGRNVLNVHILNK